MTSTTAESADLVAVLRVYNDVTEKLKRSHEALAGEVHRLRGELNEKNLQLQRRERLAALGQMAAGVAHEIRNPLGGIGIYASLLQRELNDRPQEQALAGKISAGVANVENIIRDILAFAGNGLQRWELINLGTLLESVQAQLQHHIDKLNVCLTIEDSLFSLRLKGDAGRIERALLNLTFNAMDAAGHEGRVWISLGTQDDTMVSIKVEDNGRGVDPAVMNKIFDPFFTTKDHGIGLGLAIVHSIAESHGGYIRAANRNEGGASFELCLPLAKSFDDIDQHEPAPSGSEHRESRT